MEKLGPRVRVRAVEPQQGFKVLFTFDNGIQREIDLEPYLRGPIFEPLRRAPAKFRAMKIEGGTIEDQIVHEDKVATRWTSRGVHTGEFMGIAPTGKQVKGMGILIQRLAGGKIVEAWGVVDMLGVLQQLGAMPVVRP